MSRHRNIQLSKSKAILVAAGALSFATAASATAATWTSAPSGQAGTARASAGHGHEVTLGGHGHEATLGARDTSDVLRLTVTDQLAPPPAEVAFQQANVTLAQRTYQVRAAQARDAVAQLTASPAATPRPTATATPRPTATATAPAAASGSPQQIAEAMLGSFGWSSSQFSCLDPLWAHESGWRVSASNASSGAYGIPQALPGSKMASAGPDWQTNAATQIRWGLRYIKGTYGSPCAAWSHEQATGWY